MLQYEENRRIYERSARLILLLALRDVCPGATLRVEHSIGQGVYMNVSGVSLTAALVRRIEAKMHEISARNLPIVKSRWTREQAIAYFDAQGQTDTVFIHHILTDGTPDERVMQSLERKDSVQESLLRALRDYLNGVARDHTPGSPEARSAGPRVSR